MQSDDRVIKEEGLDNLTDDELRGACRSRGMRTPYGEGAVAFMRKQLQEWLDLSLNRYKFIHENAVTPAVQQIGLLCQLIEHTKLHSCFSSLSLYVTASTTFLHGPEMATLVYLYFYPMAAMMPLLLSIHTTCRGTLPLRGFLT